MNQRWIEGNRLELSPFMLHKMGVYTNGKVEAVILPQGVMLLDPGTKYGVIEKIWPESKIGERAGAVATSESPDVSTLPKIELFEEIKVKDWKVQFTPDMTRPWGEGSIPVDVVRFPQGGVIFPKVENPNEKAREIFPVDLFLDKGWVIPHLAFSEEQLAFGYGEWIRDMRKTIDDGGEFPGIKREGTVFEKAMTRKIKHHILTAK